MTTRYLRRLAQHHETNARDDRRGDRRGTSTAPGVPGRPAWHRRPVARRRDELAAFLDRRRPPAVRVGYDLTLTTEKSLGVLALLRRPDPAGGAGRDPGRQRPGAGLARTPRRDHPRRRQAGPDHGVDGGVVPAPHQPGARPVPAPPQRDRQHRRGPQRQPPHPRCPGRSTGTPRPPPRLATAEMRYQLTRSLGVRWRPGRNGGWEIAGIPDPVLRGVLPAAQRDRRRPPRARRRHRPRPQPAESSTGSCSRPGPPNNTSPSTSCSTAGAPAPPPSASGATSSPPASTAPSSCPSPIPRRCSRRSPHPTGSAPTCRSSTGPTSSPRWSTSRSPTATASRSRCWSPPRGSSHWRTGSSPPVTWWPSPAGRYTTREILAVQQRIVARYRHGLHRGAALVASAVIDQSARPAARAHRRATRPRARLVHQRASHPVRHRPGRRRQDHHHGRRPRRLAGRRLAGHRHRRERRSRPHPRRRHRHAHRDPRLVPRPRRPPHRPPRRPHRPRRRRSLHHLRPRPRPAGHGSPPRPAPPSGSSAIPPSTAPSQPAACSASSANATPPTPPSSPPPTGSRTPTTGPPPTPCGPATSPPRSTTSTPPGTSTSSTTSSTSTAKPSPAGGPPTRPASSIPWSTGATPCAASSTGSPTGSSKPPARSAATRSPPAATVASPSATASSPAPPTATSTHPDNPTPTSATAPSAPSSPSIPAPGPSDDTITVAFDGIGTIDLPRSYFDEHRTAGRRRRRDVGLDHAYAVTSYAVQGATRAVSTSRIDPTATRAEAYVDITRGQTANHLYLTRPADPLDGEALPAIPPPPIDDAVTRRLARSTGELTAWELHQARPSARCGATSRPSDSDTPSRPNRRA